MKKLTVIFTFILTTIICLSLCACAQPSEQVQLSAPENLRMEDTDLVWDRVKNASGYIVYFEGTEHKTAQRRYDLSGLVTPATYEIEVKSIDERTNYSDSAWTVFSYTVEKNNNDDGDITDGEDKNTDDTPVQQGYNETGLKFTLLEDGTGYEVHRGRHQLTGVVELPGYFRGLPVKRVADKAFMKSQLNPITLDNCNIATTGVIIPPQVEVIGKYAFAGMAKVEEFIIPDSVKEIGMQAFWACPNLKRVKLPKGLKVIPKRCFADCALEEINFPETLEVIEDEAFYCENYNIKIGSTLPPQRTDQSFTKVVIPETVKSVGNFAFNGCTKLKDISLPANLEFLGYRPFVFTAWHDMQPDGFVTIRGDILCDYKGDMAEGTKLEIPSTIKYITGRTFDSCKNLAGVYIPDGVKLWGERIFVGCKSLTSVRLPADLEVIPDNTFRACESLKNIEIPDRVTSIGETAFRNCTSLTSVIFNNPYGWWVSQDSNATSGISVTITDPASAAEDLTKTYSGYYWKRS